MIEISSHEAVGAPGAAVHGPDRQRAALGRQLGAGFGEELPAAALSEVA